MNAEELTTALTSRFGHACTHKPPNAWHVNREGLRLLATLKGPWLRVMVPIMQVPQAMPFVQQMMEANFDETQEARYAFHQNLVWAVFQCDFVALNELQLHSAIEQLLEMKEGGVNIFFNRLIEGQVRQIITAAKLQGQSLEDTMKTLNRFYSEGVMGNIDEEGYQQQALTAWKKQLERLWPEVSVDGEAQPAADA